MAKTDIIRDPGKFEGEPQYVRDYWDDGGGEETIYDGDTPCEVFHLSDDERETVDADADEEYLLIWETEQGFVCHRILTSFQLDKFRTACDVDERAEDL